MFDLKETLNRIVAEALQQASGCENPDANVITAARPEFGDYQANGCMSLAKRIGKNPRELAQQVVEFLQGQQLDLLDSLEVAGPGFINIRLANSALLDEANSALGKPEQLLNRVTAAQRIVVDYSSPNLAKEMHVGHLRGTIIGDALARVLERLGHIIIRQNHVGDWGTQFGMLITHMQDISGGGAAEEALSDLEIFYREAKLRFDNEPEFAERARLAVVKLQSGDPEHLKAWQYFIDESLSHCQAVYDKLGVGLSADDLKPESFYNEGLPGIVEALQDKGMLKVSDGARCVFLEEFVGKEGDPLPVIVQKSDGGFLYATTDLAAVQYRSAELDVDRSLYVVDARQSLHFQQVFAVARKAGLASEKISLEHVSYGTMMGEDGKPFRTRSGDTIKLTDLLDEAVRRAFELVSEKSPQLDESERAQIAERVGISAVKYADLSKNRTSDYIFDWGTMLSFEGNTAPYLLYAYARIRSVLRKAGLAEETFTIGSVLEDQERGLLLRVCQFPEIVTGVGRDCYPNTLCAYLYELAGAFMRFYEACPILKAGDKEIQSSRLALAQLTSEVLREGLGLLGIQTLERM